MLTTLSSIIERDVGVGYLVADFYITLLPLLELWGQGRPLHPRLQRGEHV